METQGKYSRKGWTAIMVRVETHEMLEKLRSEMNLRSFNDVIVTLISMYEKAKAKRGGGGALPPVA